MPELTDVTNLLRESIEKDTFVRLTLSKPLAKDADLKKVMIKLALIKNENHLSFVYRYPTKDITKNYTVVSGCQEIDKLIENQFLIYNLFTTESDWAGERTKEGKLKLKKNKPSFKTTPSRGHDKDKNRLISNSGYLQKLNVLDVKGRVKKDKGDKYKQINKFVEIIDSLLRKNKTLLQKNPLQIVDMGAGKGYLTFALYDYLKNTAKVNASIKGVEVRPDLIALCNEIAQEVGFDQLSFELGYIGDYTLPATNMLIALHACDTATDDAIYKGIQAGADLIICAPCCHKQIRKEITNSAVFQSVLDHGILKERQAEIITDTIRALLMESAGYKTKVFEFISTEHTGKNLMIVGERHEREVDTEAVFGKIEKLKTEFGIKQHYLEELLLAN